MSAKKIVCLIAVVLVIVAGCAGCLNPPPEGTGEGAHSNEGGRNA